MWLAGPGGVGKTTLLGAFARLAEQMSVPVVWLDARTVEASPAGFTAALSAAHGLTAVSSAAKSCLLIVDGFERLTALDEWVRTNFLPQQPASSLVVIASRDPPSTAWRADPGWQGLLRWLPLRNLRPEESRALLTRRQVPASLHEELLRRTHGHPLALALLADRVALGRSLTRLADEPDVVQRLLRTFVSEDLEPDRRHALHVCAHTRATSETLLAEAVNAAEAHALFDWLRGLSFIEQRPDGLVPHDLAREVLEADLRWRDPEGYAKVHRAIRTGVVRRIVHARGEARDFYDLIFLHRHSPLMRQFYTFVPGPERLQPVAAADHREVLHLIDEREGPQSAEISRHWLQRQPAIWTLVRDASGQLAGISCILDFSELTVDDQAVDPALEPATRYARRHGPSREGEATIYTRFVVLRDDFADQGAFALLSMISTRWWVSTPRLSWSFLATTTSERWRDLFGYLRVPHVPEAGFTLGGRSFDVSPTTGARSRPTAGWRH